MRFRSIVLPVAVGLATLLAVPSSASAAAQCSLIMPTKLVVDSKTEDLDFRTTVSCISNGATQADWSISHGSEGGLLSFDAQDLQDRYFYITWQDTFGKGVWQLTPQGATDGDGNTLEQNSSTLTVKYGSRISQTVTRSSSGALTWAFRAEQWSGQAHTWVGRSKVNVGVFHQATSTAPWTYVKSATTSSTGRGTVGIAAPKSGNYHLVVAETPSVWKSYTSSVKGRI